MTQNASQNDLKCNTKPVAGCLRSDWAIVPRQIDVSARPVAFVTGKPLCMGRNSAFQLCGERIRCPGNVNKPEKCFSLSTNVFPRWSKLVISRNRVCIESDQEALLYSRSLFVTWQVDALGLCFAGERALSEGRRRSGREN